MNENDSLSRLYQEAARPEPPPALDDAILAASRRAAGAGPQSIRISSRWSVPLALAATVVLTVSVTMMVHEERPYGDASLTIPAAAPAAPTIESAAAQRSGPVAKPAYQPAPAERRDAPATEKTTAAVSSSASAETRERADKTVPPTLDAAPAARGAIATDAASAIPGLAVQPVQRDEARSQAVPAAAMRAPAPAALEKRALSSARALSSSAREETAADTLAKDEKLPERWIVEIRELKHAGHAAEAADKLTEFRKRFPAYKLPDDLQ